MAGYVPNFNTASNLTNINYQPGDFSYLLNGFKNPNMSYVGSATNSMSNIAKDVGNTATKEGAGFWSNLGQWAKDLLGVGQSSQALANAGAGASSELSKGATNSPLNSVMSIVGAGMSIWDMYNRHKMFKEQMKNMRLERENFIMDMNRKRAENQRLDNQRAATTSSYQGGKVI